MVIQAAADRTKQIEYKINLAFFFTHKGYMHDLVSVDGPLPLHKCEKTKLFMQTRPRHAPWTTQLWLVWFFKVFQRAHNHTGTLRTQKNIFLIAGHVFLIECQREEIKKCMNKIWAIGPMMRVKKRVKGNTFSLELIGCLTSREGS